MKKITVMLLAAVLVSAAAQAWADGGGKTIKFAIDPTWRPMEYEENGEYVGYSIDYFKAVCREAGREAVFEKASWDDVIVTGLEKGDYSGLDKGGFNAVMSSVTILPERRQNMDFTIPYYIIRQCLLARPDARLTNVRQLKGLKVGTQQETTGSAIVDKTQGAVSVTYETIEKAVTSLANGEIDAVICEDVVASALLGQPDYSGKIKVATVINTPGAEEFYGAAVRKGDFETLVLLNDGIKAVKEKGIENELRKKWIKSSEN